MWNEADIARESFSEKKSLESGHSWFVYLLPACDCSVFKIGFSCNPLQRVYSFSHRYFERFDLRESQFVQVVHCSRARAIESSLKKELHDFQVDAPWWVLDAAGGQTEWFAQTQLNVARRMIEAFLIHDHDESQINGF